MNREVDPGHLSPRGDTLIYGALFCRPSLKLCTEACAHQKNRKASKGGAASNHSAPSEVF